MPGTGSGPERTQRRDGDGGASPAPEPGGSTGWRVLLALLRLLPQAVLSRCFGHLADTPIPRALRGPLLGGFARLVGIDRGEAERDPSGYPTLNAFFVRRLRAGARVWPGDGTAIASPVDAILGEVGVVRAGCLLQAKGRWYDAADLLDDAAEAERFTDGSFVTLYLSPRHYHRIHAPCAGSVSRARHVPGRLFPVNAAAVRLVHGLFPRNERLICYLDTPHGSLALVAIGAYNVGRISAAFDPQWNGPGRNGWVTNRRYALPETRRYPSAIHVVQGEELMAFHLGSTVVLLLEAGHSRLMAGLAAGQEVKLGQVLATALPGEVFNPRP